MGAPVRPPGRGQIGGRDGELAADVALRRNVVQGEAEVSLRGAPDGRCPVGVDDAPPPRSVDAVEPERLDQGQGAADGARPLRDQVGVAVHEAQPAAVLDHGEDVAGEEGSRAGLRSGPRAASPPNPPDRRARSRSTSQVILCLVSICS